MSEYKPQFQVLEATVKIGKIIDFQRKGNVVRFFIGPDECNDYWGDDWDEVECPHCNKSIKLGNYEYD